MLPWDLNCGFHYGGRSKAIWVAGKKTGSAKVFWLISQETSQDMSVSQSSSSRPAVFLTPLSP